MWRQGCREGPKNKRGGGLGRVLREGSKTWEGEAAEETSKK